jgi:hypothetical protein
MQSRVLVADRKNKDEIQGFFPFGKLRVRMTTSKGKESDSL